MTGLRPLSALSCALLVIGSAAAAGPPALASPANLLHPNALKVGCPFYTGDASQHNAGYLDTKAYYGVAQVPLSLPEGASIRIEGRYPKTRYFSLQSYDGAKSGNFVDSLPDARTTSIDGVAPKANPAALPEAEGYTARYRITLRYTDPPASAADREPNTLYLGAPRFTTPNRISKQIFYRTYLPNPGSDIGGDTPVPKLTYSGPEGDIPFDQTPDAAQCANVKNTSGLLLTVSPALLPPRKIRFHALANAGSGGFYLNGDSNYLYSTFSYRYGPIILIRSRRFAVPALPEQPAPDGEPDIRYLSLCHYGLATGAVVSCLADRELLAQADGFDNIVLSAAASRPALATADNGYNWLDTAANSGEELVLRQLLARPGFAGDYALAQAQPNVAVETTLGDWAPQIVYCDAATFAATAASGGAALFAACQAAFDKGTLLP